MLTRPFIFLLGPVGSAVISWDVGVFLPGVGIV